MLTRITLLSAICSLLLATSCTDDPVFPAQPITVAAHDLPVLGSGAYYRLWFRYPLDRAGRKEPRIDVDQSRFVSVGAFRIDTAGAIVGIDGGPATFAIPTGINHDLLLSALLTVERAGAQDSTPGARLLSGFVVGPPAARSVQLKLSGADAFGATLDNIIDTSKGSVGSYGTFLLDAPSGLDPIDFPRGIWFIASDLKEKSLPLRAQPLLPTNTGWEYQAWLVHRPAGSASEYISLGRFSNPIHRDDNGAGPGAGPQPDSVYSAPGEDFVAAGQRRTLNDGTYGVVVAMSPTGIPLDHPLIRLLERDEIPAGTGRRQSLGLQPPTKFPLVEVTIVP